MGSTRGGGGWGRGAWSFPLLTQKKATPEEGNGTDSRIQLRILFWGHLSKVVTALRHLKIPTVLANKFRRKKHFTTSDWLSGYPICHLLGHAPSIKTASGTHIFADMNVVKDLISTSKDFHLWQ